MTTPDADQGQREVGAASERGLLLAVLAMVLLGVLGMFLLGG